MEGLDPVGYLQEDGKYLFDSQPSEYYYCARIFMVVVSCVCTICLMNVFIAVLQKRYSKSHGHAWRNFMMARAETAINYFALKRGFSTSFNPIWKPIKKRLGVVDDHPHRQFWSLATVASSVSRITRAFGPSWNLPESRSGTNEFIWYCCRRGVENSIERIDRGAEEMENELTKQVALLQSDIMQQVESARDKVTAHRKNMISRIHGFSDLIRKQKKAVQQRTSQRNKALEPHKWVNNPLRHRVSLDEVRAAHPHKFRNLGSLTSAMISAGELWH